MKKISVKQILAKHSPMFEHSLNRFKYELDPKQVYISSEEAFKVMKEMSDMIFDNIRENIKLGGDPIEAVDEIQKETLKF